MLESVWIHHDFSTNEDNTYDRRAMAKTIKSTTLSIELCRDATQVCASFHLRKAVRVATQIYDDALKPVRLRATQFVILLAVRLLGATTMGTLSKTIVMDPTTLSRCVDPLIRRNLITRATGTDQRHRLITLTSEGHQMLVDAYPHWEKAQATITRHLNETRLNSLIQSLNVLIELDGTTHRSS